MTAITLGRVSPPRLDATYPHTPGAPSTCAYLVLLRVEIARFTLDGSRPRWLCAPCFRMDRLAYAIRLGLRRHTEHPGGMIPSKLVSVALILTSRWTAVSCYAALCSPDVPPVRCFHPMQASAFRLVPAAVQQTSRRALCRVHKALAQNSRRNCSGGIWASRWNMAIKAEAVP